MPPSLRRGVTAALVSLLPWGTIWVVEFAGREPAVSGAAKALVASGVVLALLAAVVMPVGGAPSLSWRSGVTSTIRFVVPRRSRRQFSG